MLRRQPAFRSGAAECWRAGIGRAHNIALATLPNFVLPGDVSASKRYWKRDIIVPPVEVDHNGTISVREDAGFGYEIDRDVLDGMTIETKVLESR